MVVEVVRGMLDLVDGLGVGDLVATAMVIVEVGAEMEVTVSIRFIVVVS